MMLDPFTAMSLAGNIVQFVEFSGKVVGRVVQLCNLSSGLIKEYIEVSVSARSLKQTATALSKDFAHNTTGLSKQKRHQELRELVEACESLADDLIRTIEDLKLDPKNRKWSILRQASRGVSRKTVVHELVMRMGMLRDALNSHLLETLRYDYEECSMGSYHYTDAQTANPAPAHSLSSSLYWISRATWA